jgi:hypothetical protein
MLRVLTGPSSLVVDERKSEKVLGGFPFIAIALP